MFLHNQLFLAFFSIFFLIFLLTAGNYVLYSAGRGKDLVMVPQLTIPRTVLMLSFFILLKRLFIANADMSTKARLYTLDECCYSSCRVRFQIFPLSSTICRCLHTQKWVWTDMKETLVNLMCFFLFSHPHSTQWYLTHPRTATAVCVGVLPCLLMALYIFQGEALIWISRAVMVLIS